MSSGTSASNSGSGASPPAAAAVAALQKDAAAHLAEYFDDLHGYIEGEMAAQCEEWNFIGRANEALRSKYAEIGTRVDVTCETIKANNTQMERLPEITAQVDELEKQIAGLELVLRSVDDFTVALERKFISGDGGGGGRR